MQKASMNWNSVKRYFENRGELIDVYFEGMTTDRWLKLFAWLKEHSGIESINCYVPVNDANLDYLPDPIEDVLNQEGFYCFVSILVDGMSIFFRFFDASELECDISPKQIDSEHKLGILLDILAEVQNVVSVQRFIICPESNKNGAFCINGKFVS